MILENVKKRNTFRLAGLLLLTNFVIGVFINLLILGPLTLGTDFLLKIVNHFSELRVGVLLYLIGAGTYLGMAAVLLPFFKKIHIMLAHLFLAFSIISFAAITIDSLCILSLFSVSKEYKKAIIPNKDYLFSLGTVLSSVRMQAHLLVILVGCVSLFIFYYLFSKSKKIPRFLSLCGLISVFVMCAATLTDFLGGGLYMILFLPAGMIQVIVSIWLMASRTQE